MTAAHALITRNIVLFRTFIFIYIKIKYIIYSVFETKNIVHNI